ncbi:hypothetical protein [Priestia megaterium]|uniref:hypothetical protein n=1 Tax=Priestia megaterium TaxID=1404 RepID=UPI000BF39CD3|nr:hypothetical protein [Priestia megaterium]PFW43826.1 hypothetical protein COL17_26840 [Priestia megaterium]
MKLVNTKTKEVVFTFDLTTKELNTLVTALGGTSDAKRRKDAEFIGVNEILDGAAASNLYSNLRNIAVKNQ